MRLSNGFRKIPLSDGWRKKTSPARPLFPPIFLGLSLHGGSLGVLELESVRPRRASEHRALQLRKIGPTPPRAGRPTPTCFAVPTPPATGAWVSFRSRSSEPSSTTPCAPPPRCTISRTLDAARSRSRSRRCIGIRSGESCARLPIRLGALADPADLGSGASRRSLRNAVRHARLKSLEKYRCGQFCPYCRPFSKRKSGRLWPGRTISSGACSMSQT